MFHIYAYDDKFCVSDPDEIIYVKEFDSGEWYGPIEPPEYP
jgi:hypothetical protein